MTRLIPPSRRLRAIPALGALGTALLLASCGSEGTTASADVTTGTSATPGAASGEGFPAVVEHRFGTTTVPEAPDRVVTAGFNEQDFALALGVTPVGVREYLSYDATQRPWAVDLLPEEPLPTVGATELDLEKVAALDPDLVLGIYSYIDEPTYDLLSDLAPTIAESGDYPTGGTPWQVQTRMTGEALGKPEEAERLVADVEGEFDAAAQAHPELEGKTLALDYVLDGKHYVLPADDLRMRFFADLGFSAPEQTGELSDEMVDALDTDVLVVVGMTREDFLADPLVSSLDVVTEDRTVFLGTFDQDFAGALGFSSPLSLPFALDVAVPRLAAAADGDPATAVEPYTG